MMKILTFKEEKTQSKEEGETDIIIFNYFKLKKFKRNL